ncbi:MAG: ATP phosphoribosyltransferase regulatory subunit [Deltaproteobacteria bacterium]|nr:ATP phosphoribosyltransferase regulatory subunit [Deltaproteobacteria bacterium]
MDRTPERSQAAGRHRELPPGLGDILPEAAAGLFSLRERLLGVLAAWGYRPLLPPLLEYADVFARALADPAEEVSFHKLLDRATGHILAIRPDFTPQVARAAATRFTDAALPLRLCYEGPVVRHVPAQRGRSRQLHQVGAELLGVVDPEADAETIALVIECLRAAGLSEFKVDVGQVEFFKGILGGAELPAETGERLKDCVARKDVSELGRLLEGVRLSDAKKRLLAELPLLAGGVEVLERASALVESDHSRSALENLAKVVHFVERYGLADALTVDLGELRGVDYHTGVIYEAFVHHLGSPLCKGGRYDGLVAGFGTDLPATGFSLDLATVMEAQRIEGTREGASRAEGALIVALEPDRSGAVALARRLRGAGVRAARELVDRPLDDSLVHAREQGFRWMVALGTEGNGGGGALIVHVVTGERETAPVEGIVRRLAGEE